MTYAQGPTAVGTLQGVPFVTVTPAGPGDGGGYGPNTTGTTTAGFQEACNAAGVNGVVVIKYGTYSPTGFTTPKNGQQIIFDGCTINQSTTNPTWKLTSGIKDVVFSGEVIAVGGGASQVFFSFAATVNCEM